MDRSSNFLRPRFANSAKLWCLSLLNNSGSEAVEASEKTTHVIEKECSKKHGLSLTEGFVQQSRSRFDARSVLSVRERERREERQACEPEGQAKGRRCLCKPFRQSQRTPLAAFFNIPCLILFLGLSVPVMSWAAEGKAEGKNDKAQLVSIPLASLDVQEAVATVSVLESPQSSVDSLLGVCESEFVGKLQIEGEDIQGAIKKLCGMMEGLAKTLEPPPHEVAPNVFMINVPLKQPHQAIRSVTWKAKSLDDAMTFIELLKDGRLKAVKVFSTIPWSDNPTQPCSECPVKDLVFRLEAMKDKRHLLE